MKQVEYAGFWRRLAAHIIDNIILEVALFIMLAPFGISLMNPALGEIIMMVPASLAIGWLYYALLESSKYQATLGKMVLGIKVTNMQGQKISFARATGRHFAKMISGIILGIGFLMIAFTKKKQGLHDIIADCLVIKEK